MAKVENAMPPHAAKATDSDVDLLLVPILIVVIVVFLDGGCSTADPKLCGGGRVGVIINYIFIILV
jgi:hypothetical protein